MTHEKYVNLVRKLREWQGGATNFTSGVFGLIAKADHANMLKLQRGWPGLVMVYRDWHESEDEEVFFKTYLGG